MWRVTWARTKRGRGHTGMKAPARQGTRRGERTSLCMSMVAPVGQMRGGAGWRTAWAMGRGETRQEVLSY